jgi:F-type H+-transporting ATPase subunit epsilon
MADTMQFDLVAPERRLASCPVTRVRIPGSEGQMTVMPGHEAVLTTLRPGFVDIAGPQGDTSFVVTHGFVEITGDSVSVIAERAIARAEAHRGLFEPVLEEARTRAGAAAAEDKDAAETFVADLVHLLEQMD